MPQKLIHARTNCSALYFLTELMHDACTVRYVELTAGKKWPRPWRAWPYVATIYGLNVRGNGGSTTDCRMENVRNFPRFLSPNIKFSGTHGEDGVDRGSCYAMIPAGIIQVFRLPEVAAGLLGGPCFYFQPFERLGRKFRNTPLYGIHPIDDLFPCWMRLLWRTLHLFIEESRKFAIGQSSLVISHSTERSLLRFVIASVAYPFFSIFDLQCIELLAKRKQLSILIELSNGRQ